MNLNNIIPKGTHFELFSLKNNGHFKSNSKLQKDSYKVIKQQNKFVLDVHWSKL